MRTSLHASKYLTWFASLLLALFLTSCNKKAEEKADLTIIRPVKLLTVGNISTDKIRRLPATVQATDKVDLAFQVSGTLIDFPVKEGQYLKKGDLVAKLEPRDFETGLINANGVLAKAVAGLDFATVEYQRFVSIRAADAGAVSASSVDLKKMALKVSTANLQSAQAGVRAAKDQLSYTQLHTPFSGVVARRFVDNFQEIKAKQPILGLQNTNTIDIVVDVPQMMMVPIRTTHPRLFAEFSSEPGRQFDLKIKEMALQADSQTQTFRVVFTMPTPTGIRILPGMTATVGMELSGADTAGNIIVPLIAVFADDAGKSMVWAVDAKTMQVHRRPVTTGELSGSDSIHINSGLNAGERVAISGVSKLQENQIVRMFE